MLKQNSSFRGNKTRGVHRWFVGCF